MPGKRKTNLRWIVMLWKADPKVAIWDTAEHFEIRLSYANILPILSPRSIKTAFSNPKQVVFTEAGGYSKITIVGSEYEQIFSD